MRMKMMMIAAIAATIVAGCNVTTTTVQDKQVADIKPVATNSSAIDINAGMNAAPQAAVTAPGSIVSKAVRHAKTHKKVLAATVLVLVAAGVAYAMWRRKKAKCCKK